MYILMTTMFHSHIFNPTFEFSERKEMEDDEEKLLT